MKKIIRSKEQLGVELANEKRKQEIDEIIKKIFSYFQENYHTIPLIKIENDKCWDIKFKDYYQILSDWDFDNIKKIAGKYFLEFYWQSSYQHIYITK